MRRHLILIYIFVWVWGVLFLNTSDAGTKFPEKLILVLNPWPAGGGADIILRPLVNAASRNLGQPMVIEYHTGGSAAVAMTLLKGRKADGYTLGQTTMSAIINQHMRKVPYDMTKDFTPIMQYADYTTGLAVRGDSPWKTFKEFIDYAKANPGKIRFSSTGPSSPPYLVMASLAKQLQINWIHIPFEGGPPALAAILGRHVEAYATTMHCKPQFLAGELRLLVAFGSKRIPFLSEVPSLEELGFSSLAPNFHAIVGPKGVSPEIVETLHQAFRKAMEDKEFLRACDFTDNIPIYRSPQETAKLMQQIHEEVGVIIRDLKPSKQ